MENIIEEILNSDSHSPFKRQDYLLLPEICSRQGIATRRLELVWQHFQLHKGFLHEAFINNKNTPSHILEEIVKSISWELKFALYLQPNLSALTRDEIFEALEAYKPLSTEFLDPYKFQMMQKDIDIMCESLSEINKPSSRTSYAVVSIECNTSIASSTNIPLKEKLQKNLMEKYSE